MKQVAKDTHIHLASLANHQNNRFDNQLVGYRALIGIPHWQYQSPYSAEVVSQYANRAHQLRSRYFTKTIKLGVKYLMQGFSKTRDLLVAWYQHYTNMQELSGLNERALRDIGMTREDVYRLSSKQITTDELNVYRATLRSDRPERIVTFDSVSLTLAPEVLVRCKAANNTCIPDAA